MSAGISVGINFRISFRISVGINVDILKHCSTTRMVESCTPSHLNRAGCSLVTVISMLRHFKLPI